ncbi:MAG: hypothetical protein KAH84_07490 [Thiomargarita sp.]|nr:hypothetical protein [Thiomargarita sp.]
MIKIYILLICLLSFNVFAVEESLEEETANTISDTTIEDEVVVSEETVTNRGNSIYTNGYSEGVIDGMQFCRQNPFFCTTVKELDPLYEGGYNQGVFEGMLICKQNPLSCDITEDITSSKEMFREVVKQGCRDNPASCGIDENNDGSTQEGITQCQENPISCGINIAENFEQGILQCQNDPTSCGIEVNNLQNGIHSTFSVENGNLFLPAVDVATGFDGTITTFEVKMQIIPGREPLSFFITEVIPIDSF